MTFFACVEEKCDEDMDSVCDSDYRQQAVSRLAGAGITPLVPVAAQPPILSSDSSGTVILLALSELALF